MKCYIRKNGIRVRELPQTELNEIVKHILYAYYILCIDFDDLPWGSNLDKYYWEYSDIEYDNKAVGMHDKYSLVREGSMVLSLMLGVENATGPSGVNSLFPWKDGVDWLTALKFKDPNLAKLQAYAIRSLEINGDVSMTHDQKYTAFNEVDHMWVVNHFIYPLLDNLQNNKGYVIP